jgi:trehalose-6-phosphatase
MAVSIVLGNKTLELRPSSVDKATAAKSILQDLDPKDVDFILAIGDGKTDEVLVSAIDFETSCVMIIMASFRCLEMSIRTFRFLARSAKRRLKPRSMLNLSMKSRHFSSPLHHHHHK